ncbi:MAG: N-acetylmannosamine-6-phosphate 2-epimerase [Austwickia sp.]|nr:N-acetylmannosamine-6-phosphate 2-epimerase [Austwickia sp.]
MEEDHHVNADEVLTRLRGGLVVSCQAYPGEPMRLPQVMTAMAQAAVIGGAVGIRAQGLADLHSIRAAVDVPMIGLIKTGGQGVFITPTVADAVATARTGVEIVALDGTRRPRPDGFALADAIAAIHDEGALVMADCGCLQDALASVAAGADLVGTTLAGYTGTRPTTLGPDLEFIAGAAAMLSVPVIGEGRIRTPHEARAALDAGAFAVVVGTAITHVTSITRTFVRAAESTTTP